MGKKHTKKGMMVFYKAGFLSTSQHCCKDECKNIRATVSELFMVNSILANNAELLDEAE